MRPLIASGRAGSLTAQTTDTTPPWSKRVPLGNSNTIEHLAVSGSLCVGRHRTDVDETVDMPSSPGLTSAPAITPSKPHAAEHRLAAAGGVATFLGSAAVEMDRTPAALSELTVTSGSDAAGERTLAVTEATSDLW